MEPLMIGLLEQKEETSQYVLSKAKKLIAKKILPSKITGEIINNYIKKALRLGAWRGLKQESRALLMVASKWKIIRSNTLKSILQDLFIEIELHSLRGKALFYGIILAMKSSIFELRQLLGDVSKLLIIGISYLNKSPIYRVYG